MKLTTQRLKKLIREELEKIDEATASSPMAQLGFGGMGEATIAFNGIGPKGMGFELNLKEEDGIIEDLKSLASKKGKISDSPKVLKKIMQISRNAKKFGESAIGEATVS